MIFSSIIYHCLFLPCRSSVEADRGRGGVGGSGGLPTDDTKRVSIFTKLIMTQYQLITHGTILTFSGLQFTQVFRAMKLCICAAFSRCAHTPVGDRKLGRLSQVSQHSHSLQTISSFKANMYHNINIERCNASGNYSSEKLRYKYFFTAPVPTIHFTILLNDLSFFLPFWEETKNQFYLCRSLGPNTFLTPYCSYHERNFISDKIFNKY